MPQIENVVSQVTATALSHENSNPNGEAITIHKEKNRVRGQEEQPTPQRQRIHDEFMIDPERFLSEDMAEVLIDPERFFSEDMEVFADSCDWKPAGVLLKGLLSGGAFAASKSTKKPVLSAEQVAAKDALQGEIATARSTATHSNFDQKKPKKQPMPANFNPATCPCPGKTKNPYAHFRSEKHEIWMARNAAAAVGIDQPIAAVKTHLH